MGRDLFYQQRFQCSQCGIEINKYVWLSEVDKTNCTCDKKVFLTPLDEEEEEPPFSVGGKYRKGRPVKERNERRTKHFRKEILPTLSGFDRKHFEKTKGKPL